MSKWECIGNRVMHEGLGCRGSVTLMTQIHFEHVWCCNVTWKSSPWRASSGSGYLSHAWECRGNVNLSSPTIMLRKTPIYHKEENWNSCRTPAVPNIFNWVLVCRPTFSEIRTPFPVLQDNLTPSPFIQGLRPYYDKEERTPCIKYTSSAV